MYVPRGMYKDDHKPMQLSSMYPWNKSQYKDI